MKKFIVLLFCAFCISTQADAQFGALKKALKNKVESTVGSKLGGLLGKKKTENTTTTTTTTTATPSYSNSEYETSNTDYAGALCPDRWQSGEYFNVKKENNTGEYDSNGDVILRYKKSKQYFGTKVDAINALPAVPTARQILYPEGEGKATVEALIDYDLAYNEYYARHYNKMMEDAMKTADAAMNGTLGKGVAITGRESMPVSSALADKMMQAITQSGINLETATQADIEKVAIKAMSKEFGIPEADMSKMMTMAKSNPDAATAYLKKNYPNAAKKMGILQAETEKVKAAVDPNFDKYVELFEEAAAMSEDKQLEEARNRAVYIFGELETYANELLGQWPTSEAYAKVNAMEKELQAKTEEYMHATNTGYNDAAPAFWVEGRKAQNAVINGFNESMAEKWRGKIQEYIDYFKPCALRVADMESRLDKVRESITNEQMKDYLLQFQTASAAITQVSFPVLFELPSVAMDAPRIGNVAEEWLP